MQTYIQSYQQIKLKTGFKKHNYAPSKKKIFFQEYKENADY